MEQAIIDIFSNFKNISQVKLNRNLLLFGKSYDFVIDCNLSIGSVDIPIHLGIPTDWDRKLMDVYVVNHREFVYIPHMEENGKLCLFDLEGVLIDKNFEGLLNQTIQRTIHVIDSGMAGNNMIDFIDEFELYWSRLPGFRIIKSLVNISCEAKIIKFTDDKNRVKKESKIDKKNYSDVSKKRDNYSLITSDVESDFSIYKNNNSIRNGLYVSINAVDFIYPPDWRNSLSLDYVNNLLNHPSINQKQLLSLIDKCKQELMIIFRIIQPNGDSNILAVLLSNTVICKSESIKIESCNDIIPCSIIRCDKEFLLYRGGTTSSFGNKKLLLIGCGSIGGYLANELVKSGVGRITIVDNDILKEENIYRHFLGMEYVGRYKSKSLTDYVRKNIPNVDVCSVEERIEDAIADGSIELDDFDLIISAVGNHNVNRWLNEYAHENGITKPIIYLWNEVLGIGNHGALITVGNDGCYECFFGREDKGNLYDYLYGDLYDKTSYCEKGQSFVKKDTGCGSSFVPFSSSNSLATTLIGIELSKMYLEGRLTENIIISTKGDAHYFINAGYKVSDKYRNQIEPRVSFKGELFKKEGCAVCD